MSDPRELQISQTFLKHFEGLEDPRYEKMCDHLLVDILVIAILAVICGAGGWAEMAAFGQSKVTAPISLSESVVRRADVMRTEW